MKTKKKVASGLEASYAATSDKKSRSYSFPYGGDGGIEVFHTIAHRAAQTSPRYLWSWKEFSSGSIHFSIYWSFHVNLAPAPPVLPSRIISIQQESPSWTFGCPIVQSKGPFYNNIIRRWQKKKARLWQENAKIHLLLRRCYWCPGIHCNAFPTGCLVRGKIGKVTLSRTVKFFLFSFPFFFRMVSFCKNAK